MTIAICICTLRRPETLATCLAQVAEADTSSFREPVLVLVVDNGPDEATAAVCERAARDLPGLPPVSYLVEPERGISFARNRAVAEALARGADLVAFLDDDDHPEPSWLAELVRRQRARGAEIVYGCWTPSAEVTIPSWLGDIGFLKTEQFRRLNRYGVPGGAATCNVLLARSLLERMAAEGPLFAPLFARCGGGDTDFFIRAHRHGCTHAVAHRSRVIRGWDADRLTLGGVLRRSFRLGHSFTLIRARHATEGPGTLATGWLRLGQLLAGLPLRLWPPRRLVKRLSVIARQAGAVNALLGGECRYYGAGKERRRRVRQDRNAIP